MIYTMAFHLDPRHIVFLDDCVAWNRNLIGPPQKKEKEQAPAAP